MADKNKKRSFVWNYFDERGSNQAKCNFCSKILSFKGGATGNLLRHLKTVHPTAQLNAETSRGPLHVEKENGVSNVLSSASTSTSTDQSAKIPEGVGNVTPLPVPTSTKTSNGHGRCEQTTIDSFTRRPLTDKKTQQLYNNLVRLLVKNYLPIQLVNNEHFQSFVKNFNSNYQLPSRKTVSNTLIPQLTNLCQEKVRNLLESATAFCITTDAWTACVNTSFISIIAHYFAVTEMRSSLLDCYEYTERHIAENLCSELKRVVREWNIKNKIVAVTSDNAANITAAVRLTGWKHVPYFAHTLNFSCCRDAN
ncbi:zinc finger BED domain-containing protein 6-like [Anthonomus grandis grandis]|uniref:zinc finger BED domain-containing protein 6-like n=1 Tax=Anthonomus grandis grandis TaxID=2921223 RepID=UPI00216553D5|nr:zinc finger BED domain-containing protein 6-like [Anthonomus grandis grandis]XP_050313031.1 zinc finger BED domain-containing protein 6-like [Anthonomus grandis grandis]